MDRYTCDDVRRWIAGWPGRPGQDSIPPDLVAHTGSCATCRGALALLAAELADSGGPIQDISCDECEDDLDAFIDLAAGGLRQAARAFPAVWLHLLTCESCAELYEATRDALAAIPAAEPGRASPARPRWPAITIRRPSLAYALRAAPAQLGAARGTEGEVVVAEVEAERQVLTVSARPAGAGGWEIVVRVEPPEAGAVSFALGAVEGRASFDADGAAVLRDIPGSLLTSDAGPDLVIGVAPPADAAAR